MLAPIASAQAAERHSSSVAVQSAITQDADWLVQGQLPDGAIAWYVDRRHISPYLANYAAIGLAEAAKQTGDRTYADDAWLWLDWYAAHEDPTGFVTDYDVDALGTETSTGDEDSTDAYAGTFLSAVRAAYLAEPDAAKLAALQAGVTGAVTAIEATQDGDGLTWAKPTWHVKYLMDQSEAYNGLRSASDLAAMLGDSGLASRAARDARAMSRGIAGLWNATTASYDWAEHDDGVQVTTDWTVLYPDAMEQAWIAGTKAIAGSRARTLIDTVVTDQPSWADPAVAGYWPVAGWALLHVGQRTAALQAANSIRAGALAAGRAWPFTTGNAGQLIVLESGDSTLITP
jgi:hypothetical protein